MRAPEYAIGDLLRYSGGSTALMRVTHVSVNHGGYDHRYYGDQACGGSVGAYERDVSLATPTDKQAWDATAKWRKPETPSRADLADRALAAQTEALGNVGKERDRLAGDALAILSANGIATPERGYVAEPHMLALDIKTLARERDQARAEAAAMRRTLERASECIVNCACVRNGPEVHDCKLHKEIDDTLAPDAGKALLEELAHLRTMKAEWDCLEDLHDKITAAQVVVEAARSMCKLVPHSGAFRSLIAELAAYDQATGVRT